jgi:hypothetical protein
MKKNLLALLAFCLLVPAATVSAAAFWYDVVTNYPLGCITTNTTIWYPHAPGNVTATDMLVVSNFYSSGAAVTGRRLRVNGLNQEYIMRLFDPVTTNSFPTGSGTILYASFVANANFVPAAGAGTYFAAFNDLGTPPSATNGFEFRGRVFEIGNTNAYPFTNTVTGTFRYGVANAAGDPAQGGSASILYAPFDLIKNVDYQVVLKYDIDNAIAYMWVNPASESDTANLAGPTGDTGAVATGLAGLLFRQRTGGGTVDIRDVAVGTSFADVMTNSPGSVLIATNFNTVTNYSGNPALLEVFPTSIGGGTLSYQWYQLVGGATNAVPGANSQTYVVAQTSALDVGNYFCAVTNSGGIGALSRTNFYISVNSTPTGLAFTSQPASKGAPIGGSITLSAAVSGTGPLMYQWTFNGAPLADGQAVTGQPGDISIVSGSQTPTLTVSKLSTNETGNFSVTVTTTAAVTPNSITSANGHISVNPPAPVNISFLRSLEDSTTWQATNTSDVFAITGVITTFTNITSGTTASYYIQDATAGINLFITGDASFRPTMGDIVTASGTMSSFNNTLELIIDSTNPYQTYSILGHTNYLPAPLVFAPFSLTNNAGYMETNVEGRIIMLTNVGFNGNLTLPASSTDLFVTNGNGIFDIRFNSTIDQDTASKIIANRFAYSVTGVLTQFKSGAYANSVYELNVTRFSDVVTNPPPAPTVTATMAGNQILLNWDAVPYVTNYDAPGPYAYTVQAASDVNGPYSPIASGLTFSTTNGTYAEALSAGPRFYRVSVP